MPVFSAQHPRDKYQESISRTRRDDAISQSVKSAVMSFLISVHPGGQFIIHSRNDGFSMHLFAKY